MQNKFYNNHYQTCCFKVTIGGKELTNLIWMSFTCFRCDTRCKILGAEDLKSPACLENVVCEATRTSRETSTDRSEVVPHPDQVTDDELPAYIGTLLVTVERKIERVSLDDLTFPCIVCRNIDIDDPLLGCKCAGESCECGTESCACLANAETKLEEAARSFEVPGIKHIDSDDEEEVRMAFGKSFRFLLSYYHATTSRCILCISFFSLFNGNESHR